MKLNISRLHRKLIFYELKVIFRNRRTREIIFFFIIAYISVIILFLTKGLNILLYNYLIISSIYYLYGTLQFSWESKYFDGIYSKNIMIEDMVSGKVLFIQGYNILCFIIFIPFLILDTYQLIQLLLLMFFSIGIYPYAIIFLSSYNKKGISLNKGRTLNFEGHSWLSIINAYSIIIICILIYIAIETISYKYKLVIPGVLCAIGLVNLMLFSGFWITAITNNLKRRKYVMLNSFRNYD